MPKTPTLHADDTWSGPNHTAATLAGRDRIKTYNRGDMWLLLFKEFVGFTCEKATTDCPINPIKNASGEIENTLIHEPMHVPKTPTRAVTRKPYKFFGKQIAKLLKL